MIAPGLAFTLALIAHIAAGTLALLAGTGAMVSRKGGPLHRRCGRWYYGGMMAVVVTALILASLNPSLFLALVAVFSFYLVQTGWRAGRRRSGRPDVQDWALALGMLPAGGIMVGLGLFWALGPQGQAIGWALLAFGMIGGIMAGFDVAAYRAGGHIGPARIARHVGGMVGGMIATVTAVATVNFAFLPDLVVWLGPTALMTPLIVYWNRKLLAQPSAGPKRA